MMKYGTIILLVIAIISHISCATLQNDAEIYREALNNIKLANFDFAFMKLRELENDYPASAYLASTKFGIAEYLYLQGDYYGASLRLIEYIDEYPQNKGVVFAEAMLYKILSENMKDKVSQGKKDIEEIIKKHFFSKSLFFIFSEYKTKSFRSILRNRYRICEYVDRIEIFKNNELFLKISP